MIMKLGSVIVYVTIAVGMTMAACILSLDANAQQVPDSAFAPPIPGPAYPSGHGPVVLLDEAHFNFHTTGGRYMPFAELLRRDGYVVKGSLSEFTRASLRAGKILVIANALNARNQEDWSLPTPSAFSDQEIEAVRAWVRSGGSLLLIADHMPFAGAAEKLARAFGIQFSNGYAGDEKMRGTMVFRLSDGSLRNSQITRGRTEAERVDSVATFTGSAFRADGNVEPLLVLGPSAVSIMTSEAGQITDETPRVPVNGWFQGAVMRFGKGRVAVFGEAAMFSAQLAGQDRHPMGMNAPIAARNAQFLLNVMHWLSGRLGDTKSAR